MEIDERDCRNRCRSLIRFLEHVESSKPIEGKTRTTRIRAEWNRLRLGARLRFATYPKLSANQETNLEVTADEIFGRNQSYSLICIVCFFWGVEKMVLDF